ncbi:MAG: hypothetical protein GOV15_04575, partial [Candidatus Diapherotrites archaeon]|nr:hypothetical protein [Candidatus Diapherotrites archaeon]
MKTKLEQALDLIQDLKEETAVKIVEGKKDTRALTALGISNIKEINKGQGLA